MDNAHMFQIIFGLATSYIHLPTGTGENSDDSYATFQPRILRCVGDIGNGWDIFYAWLSTRAYI
jgi:hypothetical protein